jgi:uncharacterized protein (TIGR02246 family)
MTKLLSAAALTLALAAPAVAAPAADDVAATVIAMELAALDRGDTKGFLEISAPDVVYLDPALDKPLDGLPALTAYYATFPTDVAVHGEMSNAKVQVLGDVAILSFHYVSHYVWTNGTKKQKAYNATEVYRKTGADWRIVNTHWSLTSPQPLK